MQQFIFIGLAGGLASAVLFASALLGGAGGALLLYTLAPLPSLIAGIGWGAVAAAIAAVAGALGIGIGLGSAKVALAFFVTQGIPIVVICHLAMLNRPAAPGAGEDDASTVEWYPVGRLLAVAAIMAGFVSFATLLTLGTDTEVIRAQLQDVIQKIFSKEIERLRGQPMSPQDIARLAEVTLYVLPAASATSWLATFVLNTWLAGKITRASGLLARPWPDLAAIVLPGTLGLVLSGALVLTYFGGYLGLVASGFAGGILFAYMLVGLAIVHFVTRGKPQRAMILAGTYLALVVLNTWAAIALAVLALVEPLSPLRRWPPSNPSGRD